MRRGLANECRTNAVAKTRLTKRESKAREDNAEMLETTKRHQTYGMSEERGSCWDSGLYHQVVGRMDPGGSLACSGNGWHHGLSLVSSAMRQCLCHTTGLLIAVTETPSELPRLSDCAYQLAKHHVEYQSSISTHRSHTGTTVHDTDTAHKQVRISCTARNIGPRVAS